MKRQRQQSGQCGQRGEGGLAGPGSLVKGPEHWHPDAGGDGAVLPVLGQLGRGRHLAKSQIPKWEPWRVERVVQGSRQRRGCVLGHGKKLKTGTTISINLNNPFLG